MLYSYFRRANFRDNWCLPRLQPIEHSCGDKPYDLIRCGLLGYQLGGINLFLFLRCLKKSLGRIGIDQFVESIIADVFTMLKIFVDGGLRFAKPFRQYRPDVIFPFASEICATPITPVRKDHRIIGGFMQDGKKTACISDKLAYEHVTHKVSSLWQLCGLQVRFQRAARF